MINDDIKDEFRFLLPKGNASFELIWSMLYDIRLLKYVRQSDLKLINNEYTKICSKDKLKSLSELGYLRTVDDEIYIATNKVFPILKSSGRNIALLPKTIVGHGDINELNNTEVFIKAMKLPYFHHLFYPRFPVEKPYIIPDALLVLFDQVSNCYKLTFLEIEAGKANWDEYLENKHQNYLTLSSDIIVYNYWVNCCQLLNWTKPDINDFKFSIIIIGQIKKDWEDCFIFKENLNGK